jgi:hypothetical protein
MKKLIIIMFMMLTLLTFGYSSVTVTLNSPANDTWHSTLSPILNITAAGNITSYTCSLYSNETGTWTSHAYNYSLINNTPYLIQDANFGEARSTIWNLWCGSTKANFTCPYAMATNNKTIHIDVTAPAVGIQSPTGSGYDDDLNFSVTVQANDTSQSGTCRLYISGNLNTTVAYTNSSTQVLNATNKLKNGSYSNWYVQCNDSAGNKASTPTYTVYAGGKPSITLDSPSDGATSTHRNLQFTPVSYFSQFISCRLWTNRTGAWNYTTAPTQYANNSPVNYTVPDTDTTIAWSVQCYELGPRFPWVQNSAANSTVTIDILSPTVIINSPATGTYSNKKLSTDKYSVAVNATIIETNPDKCELWIASGTSYTVNRTVTVTNGSNIIYWNATDNTYNWSLLCNDSSNHKTSSSNLSITIDTLYPQISSNRTVSYSGSCDAFYIEWTFDNVSNYTMGVNSNSGSYTAFTGNSSSSSYAKKHNSTVTFNDAYESTYYFNISFCDQAGNCNNSFSEQTVETPIKLCPDWTIWSVYDNIINMSDYYSNSGAEYVYLWNATPQEWVYYSSASTSNGGYNLGIGDAVWLYHSTGTTYFRNNTGSSAYRVNITSGYNFLGLYKGYNFWNLSYYTFRNQTQGNKTSSTVFQIDSYASFNNTGNSYVNYLYSYTFNNLTKLGAIGNGLDTLYVYSDYNISVNLTHPGGFVYTTW